MNCGLCKNRVLRHRQGFALLHRVALDNQVFCFAFARSLTRRRHSCGFPNLLVPIEICLGLPLPLAHFALAQRVELFLEVLFEHGHILRRLPAMKTHECVLETRLILFRREARRQLDQKITGRKQNFPNEKDAPLRASDDLHLHRHHRDFHSPPRTTRAPRRAG